jgi:hypothetical protein
MGLIAAGILVGVVVGAVAVYQLVKAKKAVTISDVATQVKTDAKKL